MSDFTPGPWRIGFSDGSGSGPELPHGTGYDARSGACITSTAIADRVVVFGGDNEGCPVGVVGLNAAELQANARLIAAAPEMFALLRRILGTKRLPSQLDAPIIQLLDRIEPPPLALSSSRDAKARPR